MTRRVLGYVHKRLSAYVRLVRMCLLVPVGFQLLIVHIIQCLRVHQSWAGTNVFYPRILFRIARRSKGGVSYGSDSFPPIGQLWTSIQQCYWPYVEHVFHPFGNRYLTTYVREINLLFFIQTVEFTIVCQLKDAASKKITSAQFILFCELIFLHTDNIYWENRST